MKNIIALSCGLYAAVIIILSALGRGLAQDQPQPAPNTNVLTITLTNSPGVQKVTDLFNSSWTNQVASITSAVTGTNSLVATNAGIITTNLVPVITLTTNYNAAFSAQDYLQRIAQSWQSSYDVEYEKWLRAEAVRRFDNNLTPEQKADILARLGLRVQ